MGIATPAIAQAPAPAAKPAAKAAAPVNQAAAVEKAVEALRAAMVAGDEKQLKALTFDELTYGHSHGMLQNKDQYVAFLVGPKAPGKFQSIALSNQTINVVGKNALVRHVFDGVNINPDGTTSTSHILVLQVWSKAPAGWKLLARQACPL
jgi:hypothetical protein